MNKKIKLYTKKKGKKSIKKVLMKVNGHEE